MMLWHRIMDTDGWPEAADPLLFGDIQAIFERSRKPEPYLIATLCPTNRPISPRIFLQALKAKVDPCTHEVDFGTFTLNVSGILDPGHPIEAPSVLCAGWVVYGFKFSEPGKWTRAMTLPTEQRLGTVEIDGAVLFLAGASDKVQALRRWNGGSLTFPNLLYCRGHMFDGIFARRRGSVLRVLDLSQ